MKSRAIKAMRLGDRVYKELERQIIDGEFSAQDHLSEARICEALQVSRTPVREALFKLAQDGLVVSKPNRGFFVASSNAAKVAETYPLLARLESLALELSPVFSEARIARLEALAKRGIKAGGGARKRFEADREFHRVLTAQCQNQTLIDTIESLKSSISRWDGGPKRGLADPDKAYVEHGALIAFLRRGDNCAAARKLEQHWHEGTDTVLRWIEEHGDENE